MLISDPEIKPQIVVFPKKKGKLAHLRQYYVLYLILLAAAFLTVWLGQQSINAYWQQTYHRASPLEALNRWSAWRAGAQLTNRLTGQYDGLRDQFTQQNKVWHQPWEAASQVSVEQGRLAINQTDKQPTGMVIQPSNQAVAASDALQLENELGNTIQLKAGDKVLFAGDSIMQGIAPHVQKWLKSEYELDSVNLSKQSTGLAYPTFFDWPGTIEQALKNDQNLKLIVILLGANDPWSFPDPSTEKGTPYLQFKTPAWEKEYLARVNRIVQAAKQSQVKIIWLGLPHMKRSLLNEQMDYLDQLLAHELSRQDNVLWLKTSDLLSDGAKHYQDSIVLNGQSVRIRTKDGIHFTLSGQQFMADYIASYISFQKP